MRKNRNKRQQALAQDIFLEIWLGEKCRWHDVFYPAPKSPCRISMGDSNVDWRKSAIFSRWMHSFRTAIDAACVSCGVCIVFQGRKSFLERFWFFQFLRYTDSGATSEAWHYSMQTKTFKDQNSKKLFVSSNGHDNTCPRPQSAGCAKNHSNQSCISKVVTSSRTRLSEASSSAQRQRREPESWPGVTEGSRSHGRSKS